MLQIAVARPFRGAVGLLKNRRVLLAALVIAVLLTIALWPRPMEVDLTTVTKGPLLVTIDEEGETRVRQRFEVTSPVAGEVLRINLEPGDPVTGGKTVLATVRPSAPTPLDARSRAEAQAAVQAAEATLGRAQAERDRAATVLARSKQQLERASNLIEGGAISRDEFDARETDARTAEEALRAADFVVTQAQRDVDVARARLVQSSGNSLGTGDIPLLAPVDGVILRRLRQSQTVVPAGEPLLEVGDANGLEIVADLLSSDAVRINTGDRVLIEQWGGGKTLGGRVRRVEPSGFMKVSALGVEEQRVNVIIDFEDPELASRALGDGYRVEVRVVIWQEDNVLKVPTGTLFRRGDQWALFVVEDGRARLRTIEIGQRNGAEAQVLDGLREREQIVLYPPDTLADGGRVAQRAV
ncbi:MAG: efflux RND transporter periplasmic adaptor subunit [Luteitalea sp.]|nr:efflux RND transporter periplasmic adaptor subunit [Luteitalea sp.]